MTEPSVEEALLAIISRENDQTDGRMNAVLAKVIANALMSGEIPNIVVNCEMNCADEAMKKECTAWEDRIFFQHVDAHLQAQANEKLVCLRCSTGRVNESHHPLCPANS